MIQLPLSMGSRTNMKSLWRRHYDRLSFANDVHWYEQMGRAARKRFFALSVQSIFQCKWFKHCCTLHYCLWRVSIKPRLPFSICSVFFVSKANLFYFYLTWLTIETQLIALSYGSKLVIYIYSDGHARANNVHPNQTPYSVASDQGHTSSIFRDSNNSC